MLPVLLALVAGGALLGAGATVLSALLRHEPLSWSAVLAGAASGAVAGGVTGVGVMAGLTLLPLVALGAVTGVGTSALSSWITGTPITPKSLVTGGLAGAVGLGAFKVLAAGGVANAVLGPVVGAVGGFAVAAVSHGWDWVASHLGGEIPAAPVASPKAPVVAAKAPSLAKAPEVAAPRGPAKAPEVPVAPVAATPIVVAANPPAHVPTRDELLKQKLAPAHPAKPTAPAKLPAHVAAALPVLAAHPVLKKGSHGPAVIQVQNVVGVKPDGKFGPRTKKAVQQFQKKHGLPITGIVDSKTWKKIPAPALAPHAAPHTAPSVAPVVAPVVAVATPPAKLPATLPSAAPVSLDPKGPAVSAPTPVAPTIAAPAVHPVVTSTPPRAPAPRGSSFLKDALVNTLVGAVVGLAAGLAPNVLAPRATEPQAVVASAEPAAATPPAETSAPAAPLAPVAPARRVASEPTEPAETTGEPVASTPATNGEPQPQRPEDGITQALRDLTVGAAGRANDAAATANDGTPASTNAASNADATPSTGEPTAPAATRNGPGALGASDDVAADEALPAASLRAPRLARGERAPTDETLAALRTLRAEEAPAASEKDLWDLTMTRVGLRSNRAPVRLAQKDVMDAAAEVNRAARSGEDLSLEKLQDLNRILTRRAGSPGFRTTAAPGKPAPEAIETELRAFLRWYQGARRPNTDPVELAAKSYQWLERIQPFEDASSETARQASDLVLERNGYPAAQVAEIPASATTGEVVAQVAAGVRAGAAAQAARAAQVAHR